MIRFAAVILGVTAGCLIIAAVVLGLTGTVDSAVAALVGSSGAVCAANVVITMATMKRSDEGAGR